MSRTNRRAAPLPPEERRAALIASTLDLILERGADVSTRDIARRARVAEGTIFRVFASKDELIDAAIASALDSAEPLRALRAIDRTGSLDDVLVSAVEVLQARSTKVVRLFDALGACRARQLHESSKAREQSAHAFHETIGELIAPFADEVRCEPYEAGRRLWLLTFAASHPRVVGDEPLAPSEIVGMLLDGIRRRPTHSS